MNLFRKLVLAATLSVLAWVSAALVVAQNVSLEVDDVFHFGGREIVRVWQDFTLRENESARHAIVVFGSATIAGRIDGDLTAVLGPVRLERTAEIRGSLVVVAGDVTIAEGARVGRDLVVVGGGTTLPLTFYPGGEHIVVGNSWMGARVREVVPWITYGLLWGRLIVFSIGWVWWFVGIALVLTLAINVVLHSAVGHAADTLAARPASAFMTGFLILLLTGPVAVLLGATIIGLAIVPFALCAVVVAGITGKVSVARWIGRTILGHGSEETRLEGLIAVAVGFASICLLYAVPLVGIVTWALIGVLGLGAATLTVLGALRRERGPGRKRGAQGEPTGGASTPPPSSSAPLEQPGMAFMRSEPVYDAPIPPISSIPPAAWASVGGDPTPAAATAPPLVTPGAASLALMARATFLDRVAAGALDIAFVVFIYNVFLDRLISYSDFEGRFLLLLAYFVTFWAWKGTTLGGIVCSLRVVRLNGTPLPAADAVVRGLASIFSFVPFGLGFFWILRDPNQQAWHDTITGTCVVKVPRDYPI